MTLRTVKVESRRQKDLAEFRRSRLMSSQLIAHMVKTPTMQVCETILHVPPLALR